MKSTNTYQFESPLLRRLGYVVWIVFGVLAVFFFRERAIFTDAAFQNFHMLQEEGFYIAHGRFGNLIPQLLPWSVLQIGGSIKAIFVAYSISFILFFAAIYWLLVARLKNDFLGWSLILYFILLAYDSFFHVQSELYQGIAVLLLVFGIALRNPKLKQWHTWSVLVGLMILLAFYHKLTILFFLFCWAFFWLHTKELRHWRYGLFLVAFVAITFLKGQLWQSGYEDNRMEILREGLADYFPNFWDIPANGKFLRKCLWYYYFYPIILGFLGIWYLRRKEFLRLALVVFGSLGYILLVHYSSPNTSYRFYAEVTYLPLGLLVGLPFVLDVLSRWRSEKIILYTLLVILSVRVAAITYNGFQYRDRLDRMTAYLEAAHTETGEDLFRQYTGKMDADWIITDWAIAYETLLLTALERPDHQSTLVLDDDFMELYNALQEKGHFLARYDQIPLEDLNMRFFRLVSNQYILLE